MIGCCSLLLTGCITTNNDGSFSYGSRASLNTSKTINISKKSLQGDGSVSTTRCQLPKDKYQYAIYKKAVDFQGVSSYSMRGTRNGRLACAGMVDRVLDSSIDEKFNTLSTRDMYKKMVMTDEWYLVDIKSAQPGDVIISPTQSYAIGHVGIVGQDNKIYSNSSRSRKWMLTHTIYRWQAYYTRKKGLKTRVFRYNG